MSGGAPAPHESPKIQAMQDRGEAVITPEPAQSEIFLLEP